MSCQLAEVITELQKLSTGMDSGAAKSALQELINSTNTRLKTLSNSKAKGLGAGETGYDIEVSDEALVELTKFNNDYLTKNKLEVTESDTFYYTHTDSDGKVIQKIEVDKLSDEAEYQVLLKHELLHHMTRTQIVDKLSESAKLKLVEEAKKVQDYIYTKFGKTEEGYATAMRLKYAVEDTGASVDMGKLDAQVSEIVSILGAEVQIREFVQQLADVRTLNTLLVRFVDAVKRFLGVDRSAIRSAKYILDGVDQIVKESVAEQELGKSEMGKMTVRELLEEAENMREECK